MKQPSKIFHPLIGAGLLALVIGGIFASYHFFSNEKKGGSSKAIESSKFNATLKGSCTCPFHLRDGSPIRIPARVEVRRSDPDVVISGEITTIRLPFVLSKDVARGSKLKLQMYHSRHSNVLGIRLPQTGFPDVENYMSMKTHDGKVVAIEPDQQIYGTYTVTVPEEGFSKGTVLIATLGDRSGGSAGIEVFPQRVLGKLYVLYVDRPGTQIRGWGRNTMGQIVGACTIDVLGGKIDHLRAYVPSDTVEGEPFYVLVRPEDENSYLSHERLTCLTVFAGDDELPGRIEQVPASTCVRIHTRISHTGIYRLKVVDRKSGKSATTNPTICTSVPAQKKTFWGMIHAHSEMSDGACPFNYYFKQIRDEAYLDFSATSEHDYCNYTTDEMWGMICKTVKQWNEPGRFVVFLGYEWGKWRGQGSDRNVYYLEDDRPIYRSDKPFYPTPPDLFKALRQEKAILIPHYTANGREWCDWKDHCPEKQRLVEIYQTMGSQECSKEEGSMHPIKWRDSPVPEGYVRRALALGWRVGFTAGGDDHYGSAGTDRPTVRIDNERFSGILYNPGLMSVRAHELTRQAIWDEMWNRRVVATTGPRILLNFELSGNPIGSELSLQTNSGLAERRALKVEFHGTAPLDRIEVIRNNRVVHTFKNNKLDCKMSWEDTVPLEKVLLEPARFCPNRFCFYYVRAIQGDGNVAWASPIWIDEK